MQDYFFVRADNKFVKIKVKDILYVEGVKNYLRVVIAGHSKPYMSLVSLKQMEQNLPKDEFCRVHRSYIVSLRHIVSFDFDWVMIGETKLPMGEQFKNHLLQKVNVIVSEARYKGNKFKPSLLEEIEFKN